MEETIYVEQPEGFDKHCRNSVELVCRPNVALYGLRQPLRAWNGTIHKWRVNGFVATTADPCLYIWTDGLICLVHILITGEDVGAIEDAKRMLIGQSSMTGLGSVRVL